MRDPTAEAREVLAGTGAGEDGDAPYRSRSPIPMRVEGSDLAVETRGVVKRYGRTIALNGLDLTVPEGAFYLLAGVNGAGKSTALKVLLDLVRANAGSARVLGMDTRAGPEVRAHIGYVPERYDEHYGWLRVGALIAHHAGYYPAWDWPYAERLARALELPLDRRLGRLSKGQARRVHLLLALAHRPPVLLLDEPTDGLDPLAQDAALSLIAEHLADSPTTVVVSTHAVHEMERFVDHVAVLRDGRLTAQLTSYEMQARLRSYTLALPEGWTEPPTLGERIIRRNGDGGLARWLLWGDPPELTGMLQETGVEIREIRSVTIEDGARALLSRKVDHA